MIQQYIQDMVNLLNWDMKKGKIIILIFKYEVINNVCRFNYSSFITITSSYSF